MIKCGPSKQPAGSELMELNRKTNAWSHLKTSTLPLGERQGISQVL